MLGYLSIHSCELQIEASSEGCSFPGTCSLLGLPAAQERRLSGTDCVSCSRSFLKWQGPKEVGRLPAEHAVDGHHLHSTYGETEKQSGSPKSFSKSVTNWGLELRAYGRKLRPALFFLASPCCHGSFGHKRPCPGCLIG